MSNGEFQDDESEYVPASPAISYASTVPTLPLHDLTQPPPSPEIAIPILAHYKLCDIPGIENEQGLFATQDIEEGTRIIAERPLFTLPHPGDQLPELVNAYSQLDPSDKLRVDDLRAADTSTTEQLHNIDELSTKLFLTLSTIIIKPEAQRTDDEQSDFRFLMPKLIQATRALRTAARWHANRCSMTNLPHDQRDHLPRGTPVSGLFMERALMRHSCIPNCFASYNDATDQLIVHASRPISAGEELTVSAFADDMYYLTSSQRQEKFANWGLACTCEACTPSHPAYSAHEAARQRNQTRAILINDFLTRLAIHDDDNAVGALLLPPHMRAENEPSADDLDDAQAAILALCNDLRHTGCSTVEHVRWRIALVDRILPRRAYMLPEEQKLPVWKAALGHAKICEAVGLRCFGEDRVEFEQLRTMRCRVQVELDKAALARVEREGRREKDAERVLGGKMKGRKRKGRGKRR